MSRFLRICWDVSGLGYRLFACVLLADFIIGLPYPCVNRQVSPLVMFWQHYLWGCVHESVVKLFLGVWVFNLL
jgi:hypothetical protein